MPAMTERSRKRRMELGRQDRRPPAWEAQQRNANAKQLRLGGRLRTSLPAHDFCRGLASRPDRRHVLERVAIIELVHNWAGQTHGLAELIDHALIRCLLGK